MVNRTIICILLVSAFCVSFAAAETVGSFLNYQGRLTDAAGNPLTGMYSVRFQIYDAATGGTVLGMDTHTVTATDGLFSTIIETDPSAMEGRRLWLGVKVGSDPEMTPRQELRAVPYAFSLKPGAVINGSGTSKVLEVRSGDPGVTGVNVVTTGGPGSRGIRIVTNGSSGFGLQSVTSGGWSRGISAVTSGANSPGVETSTTGTGSTGVISSTTSDNSHGVSAQTSGSWSKGVFAQTSGAHSSGVEANTTGAGSYGVVSYTSNGDSHGVYAETSGNWSKGVYAQTTGAHSSGVEARTTGPESYGIVSSTTGSQSRGVSVETAGWLSHGIVSGTTGDGSEGLKITTSGLTSDGIDVGTSGAYAQGIDVETSGETGNGIHVVTSGEAGIGIYVETSGVDSTGVLVSSSQDYGIVARTGRGDHHYGVFTPDEISALAYDTNSGDVAEYMPVTEDVLPGTVLVIGSEGKLQPCTAAYDTRVAGIVSTQPGLSLATKDDGNPGEEIVAVAGRVPCKVDAGYGAIHAGDLLSTSATPGYAMKAEPIEVNGRTFYPSGIVLGKAMGTLENGTGTIEVLVTLQ